MRLMLATALAGAAALTLAVGLRSIPAAAQTIVTCDEAALSSAITAANSGGGTLLLSPGCTYELTSALDPISDSVNILGGGATITRAETSPHFRIFDVDASGKLTLNALTVSNGVADTPGDVDGGAIRANGPVTLNATLIRDSQAQSRGGGIYTSASLRLSASTIEGNQGGEFGGGIYNDGGTVSALTASAITANTADTGGGIANTGQLDLNAVAVNDNTADGEDGFGGGIYTAGTSSSLRTFAAAISGNKATGAGGRGAGIATLLGTLRLNATTVTANTANTQPGGIYRQGGTVALTASSVFANVPTNCVGSATPVPGCAA